MIYAEAHSDDWTVRVQFDATRWFAEADDEEILALAACGWGGDYPADAVACEMAGAGAEAEDSTHTLDGLFAYLPGPLPGWSGFECHVDEQDAWAWLDAHRPPVAERLRAGDVPRATQSGER